MVTLSLFARPLSFMRLEFLDRPAYSPKYHLTETALAALVKERG